jgi:integrase
MCPVKALLAEAYELELTRTDAARVRIVVPGEPPAPKPKALTLAQVDEIRSRVPERDRLLFLLLSRTGLRIGEALGLRWRDLEIGAEGPVLAIRVSVSRRKVGRSTQNSKQLPKRRRDARPYVPAPGRAGSERVSHLG